ncbi:MAG: SCO family protein [Myxococcales bacterium FL481]|nr:MAG: SCO family protein [Myxococcales bacterium FL481]
MANRASPDAAAARSGRSTNAPLVLAALALGFLALVGYVMVGRGSEPASERPARRALVDFRLSDARGQQVRRADIAGEFLVVNFVHTSCSFECRRVNERMAEIQRAVADEADVRLVSLTVDPRTDTPSVLAKYAAEFGAELDRWLFLTGEKPGLYHLIESSFLERGEPDPIDPIPGGFLEADRIALVDRQGFVREYFPGMSHTTPAAVLDAIARLRRESGGG